MAARNEVPEGAGLYPSDKNRPTVLMFQPKRFEVAEGDRLREWEEHLRKDVGLHDVDVNPQATGIRTISYANGHASDIDEAPE
ncbi:hypothetical protein [Streptomyces sp. NPDC012616]|uniref:hypothetical protein n=1 Tax=Streptomyces sp. NPDC012616 TaxID=3364840 RepID=UPI0036E032EF